MPEGAKAPPAKEVRRPSSEAYRAVLSAELFAERGDLQQALEQYREAVVHDPDSPRLRVRLGQLYLARGELERAREQAKAALSRAPEHVEAARLYAHAHVLLGEKGQARVLCERALEHHPGDRPLSSMLAELYLEAGEVQAAEAVLEALMDEEPGAIDGYVMLARLFADRGEVGRALVHTDRALDRDERALEALELRRTLLYAQGRFSEALEVVHRIASERGDSPPMRHDLLVAELLAGDEASANALVETWRTEDKSEGTLLLLSAAHETAGLRERALALLREETHGVVHGRLAVELGRLAHDAHRFAEASTYLCAVRPDEGDPTWYDYARALCARALGRDGRPEEAKAALEEGLKARPASWRLLLGLVTLREQQRASLSDEALLTTLEHARERAPDDLDLLETTARALEALGRVAAARALLEEELMAGPQDGPRLLLLARHLERQGDADGAVRVAEELMLREEPTVELLNFAAYTMADNGIRPEEARRYAWRAVLRGPLNGYVVDTLGWAEMAAGDADRAVDILRRADRLSPDEPEILLHLAAALLTRGQRSEALREARRGLSLAEPADPVRRPLMELIARIEGAAP